MVAFAKANPQLQIGVTIKPNRHPVVRGFYLKDTDRDKNLSLRNLNPAQIAQRVSFLRDTTPGPLIKNAKIFRTSPSIQGPWEMGQMLERPHRVIRA